MTWLLRLASLSAALLSVLTIADLKYRTSGIVLWPLKILVSAVAPPLALIGAALALGGMKRRDPRSLPRFDDLSTTPGPAT